MRKLKFERGSPDAQWVSRLAGCDTARASEFITEIAEEHDFNAMVAEKLLNGGRTNYVQIAAPFELYSLARLLKPKVALEVGVSAGVSSAYLLRALEQNGKGTLHSIDMPEKQIGRVFSYRRQANWALPPGKTSGWAIPNYLKAKWTLHLGNSSDVLPDLLESLETSRVDFFLYDVPYTINSAIFDFSLVNKKLSKNFLVIADNALKPITWWARLRGAKVYQRKNSGLRGFSEP